MVRTKIYALAFITFGSTGHVRHFWKNRPCIYIVYNSSSTSGLRERQTPQGNTVKGLRRSGAPAC